VLRGEIPHRWRVWVRILAIAYVFAMITYRKTIA
jgi:hypothetical protein